MKKGIQLSVNFLVMFILAIAIFGVGIVFLNKLVHKSDEITKTVDERTQQEILAAMARTNSKIVIPGVSQTAERDSITAFPIGVKNVLDNNYYFIITPTLAEYAKSPTEVYAENTITIPTEDQPKAILAENNFLLVARAEKFTNIGVKVPKGAPKGQYAFDIVTQYDNDQNTGGEQAYPPALRIYIKVK
ncbi:hypothetical protein JW868_02965 [Candidatus Woesearchaeota archaeon]|nr:hypothetical protein [Candidatus Woesearchaeota archaeon]